MCPRPKRLRKISDPPLIAGFKPYGASGRALTREKVFLHFEEYEALRLCDHKGFSQVEAALAMEVSRPTLTRIYARALQKIADAFVNGKQIIIEGGKIFFDSEWYTCEGCGCFFNHPDKASSVEECPLCGHSGVSNYTEVPEEIQEKSCRRRRLRRGQMNP